MRVEELIYMDEDGKRALIEAGVNVDIGLERFMHKEAIYEKFMKKFLDDKTFDSFYSMYQQENCEEAFKAAHTLKGVVGNLGFDRLYELMTETVEDLRNNNMENVKDKIEEIRNSYNAICGAIRKYI